MCRYIEKSAGFTFAFKGSKVLEFLNELLVHVTSTCYTAKSTDHLLLHSITVVNCASYIISVVLWFPLI